MSVRVDDARCIRINVWKKTLNRGRLKKEMNERKVMNSQTKRLLCSLLIDCRNRSSGALVSLVDGEESTCEGRSTEK